MATFLTAAAAFTLAPMLHAQAGAPEHKSPPSGVMALEQSIVDAVDSTIPSVVSIESMVPMENAMQSMGLPFMDPFLFFDPMAPPPSGDEEEEDTTERLIPQGGSGVVHSADGYIVTNNHVVEDAVTIRVVFQDGTTYEAEKVGGDVESDLAVLRIEAEDLPAVRYAEAEAIRPGQFAVAVGMPMGLDYSVTVGHVSALGRGGIYPQEMLMQMQQSGLATAPIQNFIQTDASINPGNSGGPLVDLQGQVMGINTIVQGGIGGGFGFAIPSDMVVRVVSQLIDKGSVSRAWLGVSLTDMSYEKAQALAITQNRGALIEEVFADTPAERAGLLAQDVITAVDGVTVIDSKDVVYRISSHLAGEDIQVSFLRGGEPQEITVKTGERNEGLEAANAVVIEEIEEEAVQDEGRYGMALEELDSETNLKLNRAQDAKGVLVLTVLQAGPAHRAGLRAGDVLIDVDGAPVMDPDDVRAAIDKSEKSYIPLTVERDGQQRFVALKKLE